MSPSTWLLTIATRLSIDVLRKQAAVEVLEDDYEDPTPTPDIRAGQMRLGREIEEAAESLTTDHLRRFATG